jgi:hypothetical protein
MLVLRHLHAVRLSVEHVSRVDDSRYAIRESRKRLHKRATSQQQAQSANQFPPILYAVF